MLYFAGDIVHVLNTFAGEQGFMVGDVVVSVGIPIHWLLLTCPVSASLNPVFNIETVSFKSLILALRQAVSFFPANLSQFN